jgi:hypothetical protein
MADTGNLGAPVPWREEIRMIARGLPLGLAAIVFGTVLSGQAFTDHAAAVAGAAAGVAGATAIKDPLTRLLDAASGAANTAAEAPKPSRKSSKGAPEQPAAAPATTGNATTGASASSSSDAPVSSAPARSSWRRSSDQRPTLTAGQASFSRYQSPVPESNVSTAQLRSVSSGASNSQVIASLGTPAARITMDDGGHLVEILEYTSHGNRVGSVRCSDGHVESVNAGR